MFSKLWQKSLFVLLLALTFLMGVTQSPASASTDEARTVSLTANQSITLTERDVVKGKRLFNSTCAQCHVGGASYTNPDVGLKSEELELATPRRDNILAIVDYVKNPTTYDGVDSLLEYHPNTQLKSEYPKLRNLTDEDLKLIAGFILFEAKNLPGWGGTKSDTHSDMSKYLS